MSQPDYLVSHCAQVACVWEVTARKPGNVHRFRDFDDVTYLDFVTSASVVAHFLAEAAHHPVGATIHSCARFTRSMVGTNTNLGIILLLVPLAKASSYPNYEAGVESVLAGLTVEDAAKTYDAIRVVKPGGLGQAKEQDVHNEPTLTLRQAMQLAAERDTIALQYANGFREVFHDAAPAILHGIHHTGCVEGGIVYAHLQLMSRYPDTLIARKRGTAEAEAAAQHAQWVLDLGWPHTGEGRQEIVALDAWLRAEGHSRNPGTTADLIAAALFVLLRRGQLNFRPEAPWALPPALIA